MIESYCDCIRDLLGNEKVLKMRDYQHHLEVNVLYHCIFVSYTSYRVAKRFGFNIDSRAMARGALLHDFYLYDWRDKLHRKPHAFRHARVALINAEQLGNLSAEERDVILKHMWPLTVVPPKYLSSFIVTLADKYCALMEVTGFDSYFRARYKKIRSNCKAA